MLVRAPTEYRIYVNTLPGRLGLVHISGAVLYKRQDTDGMLIVSRKTKYPVKIPPSVSLTSTIFPRTAMILNLDPAMRSQRLPPCRTTRCSTVGMGVGNQYVHRNWTEV